MSNGSKKAVVITGGARRLGRAMAERFAIAGYDIALHYFCSEDDALTLQQSLQKQGTICQLFEGDLRNMEEIPILMEEIQQAMPHCRVLINNASTFQRMSFADTSPEFFDDTIAINAKAPFFLTQSFAETFKQGAVINMLDVAVETNRTPYFAYLLAKKMLAEFTLMAAKELAPDIRVNGICPGMILPSGGLRDIESYEKSVPMKRKASPEDIADAALLLAENPFLVGQWLYVDGGEHLTA